MTDRNTYIDKINKLSQAITDNQDSVAFTHCLDLLLGLYSDSLERLGNIAKSLGDLAGKYKGGN